MKSEDNFREQLAWAAGLFEGEGNFHHAPKKRSVNMVLSMADEDRVRLFHEIIGIGTVRPQAQVGHWKPMYKWATYSFEGVQAAGAMLFPWLGERRRAAYIAVIEHGKQGTSARQLVKTCEECGFRTKAGPMGMHMKAHKN